MGNSTYIIIGVIVVLAIAAAVAYFYWRNKNLSQLFNDVYLSSTQIPKQKRTAFLLLMFRESLAASKKKQTQPGGMGKFNNPKFLEVQLLQMSTILKDRSKVKDKQMKRALQLLDAYILWEKKKNAPAKSK